MLFVGNHAIAENNYGRDGQIEALSQKECAFVKAVNLQIAAAAAFGEDDDGITLLNEWTEFRNHLSMTIVDVVEARRLHKSTVKRRVGHPRLSHDDALRNERNKSNDIDELLMVGDGNLRARGVESAYEFAFYK